MFSIFKRKRSLDWEINLILSIMNNLNFEKKTELLEPINTGLLKKINYNASTLEGYNNYIYDPIVYENEKNERNYHISNIELYDNNTNSYIKCIIHVSYGIINGYTLLPSNSKYNFDYSKSNFNNFQIIYKNNEEYALLSKMLTEEEKELVNPSDVYIVELDDFEVFHIKDLEDGDFIGMDQNKRLYKVTHNPPEIEELKNNLKDIINMKN